MDDAQQLLSELCADLRLLRTQAGGPSLRTLAERVRIGKSQLGAILNGQLREPPDWQVVAALVDSCAHHAQEHGLAGRLALPTGVEEYWRPRHTMVEHAFEHQPRRAGPPTPTHRAPAPVAPRQLPAPLRRFVGRARELARLTAMVGDAGDTEIAATIVAIVGPAGVGKSSLAVRWAHQVAAGYPDGQLYLNLRGLDPGGSVTGTAEALRALLDALAAPPESIPNNLDAQSGLYRSLLADRRMLVLLDNARDAEQVRPLLPATPGCLAIITSRDRLTGLVATDDVEPVGLDLLPDDEAREMLAQRLGSKRLAAQPQAVQDIIDRCAGLPLALAITAARAALQAERPLAAIASELLQARDTLDPFASGDPLADVRSVFSWSYDTLSPDAARLFRLLALAPGPTIGVPAAASLAGLPERQLRATLAELSRAQMIMETAQNRYAFHDLLRTYAIEQTRAHDTADVRDAAVRRVLSHYLHTAGLADRKLYAVRTPIALLPVEPGACPETVTDLDHAAAWFATEHRVLIAAVEESVRHHLHAYAWQLGWVMNTFLIRQGHWLDCRHVEELGLDAARRSGDPYAEALCNRMLGRASLRLCRFDEAHERLTDAVRIWDRLDDTVGQAHDHLNIGEVYMRRGRLDDALRHAHTALDLYRLAGYEPGQANALNNTGFLYAQLGNHDEALRRCEEALALHQRTGDEQGEATTWDSLGYTHHVRAEHEEAIACYQRALDLYRGHGSRYFEAVALVSLGDTYSATGQVATAGEVWHGALDIMTELDIPERSEVVARLNRSNGYGTAAHPVVPPAGRRRG